MMTYPAPASASIGALISPVNAPSRAHARFWPAMPMFVLRAASATAWRAVNGGAMTISTSSTSATRLRNCLAKATASWTVLNIFQFAATNGVRMVLTSVTRRPLATRRPRAACGRPGTPAMRRRRLRHG